MFKVIGRRWHTASRPRRQPKSCAFLFDEHGKRSDAGFKETNHAIAFVFIQCFHFSYCSTCGMLCNQGLLDAFCICGEKQYKYTQLLRRL